MNVFLISINISCSFDCSFRQVRTYNLKAAFSKPYGLCRWTSIKVKKFTLVIFLRYNSSSKSESRFSLYHGIVSTFWLLYNISQSGKSLDNWEYLEAQNHIIALEYAFILSRHGWHQYTFFE